MDLRSDALYWPDTCPRTALPTRRAKRARVDVLILGSGITGALAAHTLIEHGATVAIADARPPATGSTPASTALIQFEIDTPLVRLGRLLSPILARQAYHASRRALKRLAALAGQADAELKKRASLQLAAHPAHVNPLRAEARARRAADIPARFLSRGTLAHEFNLACPGALFSDLAYELNPLKLTHHLLESAVARGARLLPRCKLNLDCLLERRRPFHLSLPAGAQVSFDHVVVATGYETPEQFAPLRPLTELRSTYALATEPFDSDPWPGRMLLWETGDPYFYARTTADNRIIIGGEDEPFTTAARRDAKIAAKARVLLRKLHTLLPGQRFRAEYRWAGTFAQTRDGLPFIGPHPDYPGVFFALGYGGNGITFSELAAQIIAASITGRRHPDAHLFTFDRTRRRK